VADGRNHAVRVRDRQRGSEGRCNEASHVAFRVGHTTRAPPTGDGNRSTPACVMLITVARRVRTQTRACAVTQTCRITYRVAEDGPMDARERGAPRSSTAHALRAGVCSVERLCCAVRRAVLPRTLGRREAWHVVGSRCAGLRLSAGGGVRMTGAGRERGMQQPDRIRGAQRAKRVAGATRCEVGR